MARELKVFGYTALNPYTNPSIREAQVRIIVAAHSVAELMRITGATRTEYNWSGAITGNDEEIAMAMIQPLTPFMRGLNARGQWYLYPGARPRSYDPMVTGAKLKITYSGQSEADLPDYSMTGKSKADLRNEERARIIEAGNEEAKREIDQAPLGYQRDDLILRHIEAVYNSARRDHTGGDIRSSHLAGLKAIYDLGILWGWTDAHDAEGANA